jgi:hypothetical protein
VAAGKGSRNLELVGIPSPQVLKRRFLTAVRTDRCISDRPQLTLPHAPARPSDRCDEGRLGGLIHEYLQVA